MKHRNRLASDALPHRTPMRPRTARRFKHTRAERRMAERRAIAAAYREGQPA